MEDKDKRAIIEKIDDVRRLEDALRLANVKLAEVILSILGVEGAISAKTLSINFGALRRWGLS